MEEGKREVDPCGLSDQKEDDELGQFFAKLATLVPKLQCGWEGLHSSSQDHHPLSSDPWSHQGPDISCRRCGANTASQHNSCQDDCNSQQQPITESQLMGDSQRNYILTPEASETCHRNLLNSNLRSNQDSNVNIQSITCNQTQPNLRLSGSNYVIKPCKVRNRLAPYRINKNEPKNHTSNNNNLSRPTTRKILQSTEEPEAEEQRLELITDVIEYIHTLKSLLDNSQTKTYDIGTDVHIPSQRPPLPEGLNSQRSSAAPAPIPSQGHVPTPGGATAFLGEAAPLDRAMELLEYKTGAISITA